MQANQTVTFLTDGGDDVRDLPRYLNPDFEHRSTGSPDHAADRHNQHGQEPPRGEPSRDDIDLPLPPDPAMAVAEGLVSHKWFCWHGNLVSGITRISDREVDAEMAQPSLEQARFLTALREFNTLLRVNASSILNYGERRRAGEVISSSTAEFAVNQVIGKRMVKKQQMRWSPRRAPPATGPHPGPQQRPRRLLRPLVPRLHPHPRQNVGRSADARLAPAVCPALPAGRAPSCSAVEGDAGRFAYALIIVLLDQNFGTMFGTSTLAKDAALGVFIFVMNSCLMFTGRISFFALWSAGHVLRVRVVLRHLLRRLRLRRRQNLGGVGFGRGDELPGPVFAFLNVRLSAPHAPTVETPEAETTEARFINEPMQSSEQTGRTASDPTTG